MSKELVVGVGAPSPAPLPSPPMCLAGSGDISTSGIPEEDIFQVFPRFLLLLHVAYLNFGKMLDSS